MCPQYRPGIFVDTEDPDAVSGFNVILPKMIVTIFGKIDPIIVDTNAGLIAAEAERELKVFGMGLESRYIN